MKSTYLYLMPYEVQDMIWKYVYEMRRREMHVELISELSNSSHMIDTSPPQSIYMKKLNEVMHITPPHKCYKYFIWYLQKYFSTRKVLGMGDRSGNGFDTRGRELFNHINNMSHTTQTLTYHMQNYKLKNQTVVLEMYNRMKVLTYAELHAFKLHLINVTTLL